MRRTKPDRWERLIIKTGRRLNAKKETAGFRCEGCLEYQEVAQLLRREHRAVVRMVHNCVPNKAWSAVASLGYGQAVEDILNLLEARAR